MKCLNCNKRVAEFGAILKNGSYTIRSDSELEIEYENEDSFVRCPHCKAKNIIASEDSPSGGNKMYFHHIKD
jgi:DNA-directed RNA polymerase subunit RPC12/RpoP